MESKVKLLGHAVHPVLIVFPLGLLITALIFDIIYYASDNASFATTAYWCIAAGIIGGLAAGAIIGGAAAHAGPGYYYGPGPVYYGPRCWWRRERVWDGWGWRLRRVRVCD